MALKVHLLQKPDDVFLKELRKLIHTDISFTCSENIPAPADYEILVSGVPDEQSLEASPALKHLIIPWAGLPRATGELMKRYPHISVHNIHHNAAVVAEMAIALMMNLAKNLTTIDASLREHDWSPRYEASGISFLPNKRVLILGYGAIGREIGCRCRALGMTVCAVRRTGAETSENGLKICTVEELDGLLEMAEVLFLTVPLTDQTKGMFGADRLALLPDGCILINVSRGRIIGEKALYESLKSGRIRAGLDVWYNYPDRDGPRTNTPPSQYPFHKLPNVIMTPHLAGHCEEIESLRARDLAILLNCAARGEEMPNRVQVEHGY